ncbi:MAG: hypothetical protein HC834_08560 [Rhodospirillales bacterium]|nr:hypothetical protein [Rhodospirillales bacterium]
MKADPKPLKPQKHERLAAQRLLIRKLPRSGFVQPHHPIEDLKKPVSLLEGAWRSSNSYVETGIAELPGEGHRPIIWAAVAEDGVA